jgi:hypothetical protein
VRVHSEIIIRGKVEASILLMKGSLLAQGEAMVRPCARGNV